jgi:nucleotide-binding universal stress UspA family protein
VFAKMLLPVDGSQCSLRAVRAASEIANRFQSEVTLLHVMHMPEGILAAAGMAAMAGTEADAMEMLDQAARRILDEARPLLDLPDERVKRQVEYGHPAEVISRVAAEGQHDLMVMGSRGLSEVGAFFLGSVSARVLHHAPCPVLIMR